MLANVKRRVAEIQETLAIEKLPRLRKFERWYVEERCGYELRLGLGAVQKRHLHTRIFLDQLNLSNLGKSNFNISVPLELIELGEKKFKKLSEEMISRLDLARHADPRPFMQQMRDASAKWRREHPKEAAKRDAEDRTERERQEAEAAAARRNENYLDIRARAARAEGDREREKREREEEDHLRKLYGN